MIVAVKKENDFQTNMSIIEISLKLAVPCDYRATWILGCEERVRDQSGGAGPGGGNYGDVDGDGDGDSDEGG